MCSENKEVLVVLRNEKGLESFSKVIVDQNNNVTVTADSDYKLDNGTYTVLLLQITDYTAKRYL